MKLTRHRTDVTLGPPGTGKTTHALGEVERTLKRVSPHLVHLLAYTRRAADEASRRALAKFGKEAVQNFRTLHSLAYRLLGVQHGQLMERDDYTELGELLGIRFSSFFDAEEAAVGGQQTGDVLRAVVEHAAATCAQPEDVAARLGAPVDRFQLRRYVSTLAEYKADMRKLDFSDILQRALELDHRLEAELVVIDEAQDLSLLQWRLLAALCRDVKRVLVVGDDDQAIFRWAGADVSTFLGLKGTWSVLDRTHRLPMRVWAAARKITDQIKVRKAKEWRPAETGRAGSVETKGDPLAVDLHREGTYLLLARNGYLLDTWVDALRAAGLTYKKRQTGGVKPEHLRAIRAWERIRKKDPAVREDDADLAWSLTYLRRVPTGSAVKLPEWYTALTRIKPGDAAYYRAALRRGAKLDGEPLHRVNTVHGVKGAEADHVVLLTDVSPQTEKSAQLSPDDEHRVFYVALTRARKTVQVVVPQGQHAYRGLLT